MVDHEYSFPAATSCMFTQFKLWHSPQKPLFGVFGVLTDMFRIENEEYIYFHGIVNIYKQGHCQNLWQHPTAFTFCNTTTFPSNVVILRQGRALPRKLKVLQMINVWNFCSATLPTSSARVKQLYQCWRNHVLAVQQLFKEFVPQLGWWRIGRFFFHQMKREKGKSWDEKVEKMTPESGSGGKRQKLLT